MRKIIVILPSNDELANSQPRDNFEKDIEDIISTVREFSLLEKCKIIAVINQAWKDKVLVDESVFPFLQKFIIPADSPSTAATLFNLIHFLSQKIGETSYIVLPLGFKIYDKSYFMDLVLKTTRLSERTEQLYLLGSKTEAAHELGRYILPTEYQPTNDLSFAFFHVASFEEYPALDKLPLLAPVDLLEYTGIIIGKSSAFLKAFLAASLYVTTKEEQDELLKESFEKTVLMKVPPKLTAIEYKSKWDLLKHREEDLEGLIDKAVSGVLQQIQ